jgi:hypothetical protein
VYLKTPDSLRTRGLGIRVPETPPEGLSSPKRIETIEADRAGKGRDRKKEKRKGPPARTQMTEMRRTSPRWQREGKETTARSNVEGKRGWT